MKITAEQIISLKNKRKIVMLTAYDFPTGQLLDKAGIDIVLVGDSLANVVLGLNSTTEVGMNEMLHHSKAVAKGVKNALLVGDMPFNAYQTNTSKSLENAVKFVKEGGCDAVKIEWFTDCLKVSREICDAKIPVMGHIGLTPQTAEGLGGFKVQGKDAQSAKELIKQAQELEQTGCFSIVHECVPDKISEIITKKIKIPTIGIGAGVHCDGQVLVINDMLGLFERYTPKFVKKYADLSSLILKAVGEYKKDVLDEKFPGQEHSFKMSAEELKKL